MKDYKRQLKGEIAVREDKIKKQQIELIALENHIKIGKKRLDILKNSSSIELVVNILQKSGLNINLFIDYDSSFRIMTQDEKILNKLDNIFGINLDRNGGGNRISHTFKY